eukprot:784829-Amphidinium_carterae.3
MKRDAESEKAEAERKLATLRKYEETLGAHELRTLAQVLPNVELLLPAITPVPSVCGSSFQLAHVPFEASVDACAWSHYSKRTSLASSLEKEWLQMHQAIPHDASKPTTKPALSRCYGCGMCVCSTEGQQKWRLRNRLLQVLKTSFHGRNDREKLCRGEVVMHCSSSGFVGEPADHDALVMEEVWLHVSLLILSPYKLTVQNLQRIDCPPEDPLGQSLTELVHLQKPVPAQATKQFYTDMHALVLLDPKQIWTLSFYELQLSGRALLSLDPSKITVLPMSRDFLHMPLWPPIRKRQVGTEKRRAQAGKRRSRPSTVHSHDPSVACEHTADVSDAVGGEAPDDCEVDEADVGALIDEMQDEPGDSMWLSEMEDLLDRVEAETYAASLSARANHSEASTSVLASVSARETDINCPSVAEVHSPARAAGSEVGQEAINPSSTIAAVATTVPVSRTPHMQGPRCFTGMADATLFVPGGKICYYASKSSFEARCSNRAHGTCVVTRTNRGRKPRGSDFPLGGRPVAWMALWLSRSVACADKASHWAKEDNMFDHASRIAKRQELEQNPHARDVLAFERVPEVGEESERADLKGLWP